ncbi:hypothetical protein GGR52DRAFT_123362 [Hypoxylon sp. FL1284]|nr:hypothetical protein GGR52DRAFT_123362 [Hypoxylon sp. FL1284]
MGPTGKPAGSKSKKPKPEPDAAARFCPYCGTKFTRKEHLERHLTSHTGIKPYTCPGCYVDFGRRDLLSRHINMHHHQPDAPDDAPAGARPSLDWQQRIACESCALAKTGCDKKLPCTRCVQKGLDCKERRARRANKMANRKAQAAARTRQSSLDYSSDYSHVLTPRDTTQRPLPDFNPLPSPVPEQARAPMPTSAAMETANLLSLLSPKNGHRRNAVTGSQFQPNGVMRQRPATPLQLEPNDLLDMSLNMGLPSSSYLDNDSSYVAGTTFANPTFLDWQNTIDLGPNNASIHQDSTVPSAFTDGSQATPATGFSGATPNSSSSKLARSTGSVPISPPHGEGPTTLMAELEQVVLSEDAWPLARCNPLISPNACPKTAIVHLEWLKKSRYETTWAKLADTLSNVDWDATDMASVIPMQPHSRDMLLAMAQGFLHKALDIHRSGVQSPISPNASKVVVLPPANILEYFLRSYVRNLSSFYSLVMANTVDPNDMLANNRASSTLLVLLMIAQGAAAVPTAEAQALSTSLIETCRISLFDVIEKDIEMSADPTVLRCALLFLLLGAWSGDKWLMDIAMGQRGMYLSMLRHAGMLVPQPPMIPTSSSGDAPDNWQPWRQRESQNRIVYNFIMVDQELSLFHDTATMLSPTELCCPLPGPDLLWRAANADQWLVGLSTVYGTYNPPTSLSLRHLFQEFLSNEVTVSLKNITARELRLLLHPLQFQMCNVRDMLSCAGRSGVFSNRLGEAQSMCQKWYELAVQFAETNPNCSLTRGSLVLYHLMSLNGVADFPEIEKFARRDGQQRSYWEPELHSRLIQCRAEAVFRCGQVYRLIKLMPQDGRPSWWSAAVYRATLILWADSVQRAAGHFQGPADAGNFVAIDRVTPEDPLISDFIWRGKGVPSLTFQGYSSGLNAPSDVLDYALELLEGGLPSRFRDGIIRKLKNLAASWASWGTNDSDAALAALDAILDNHAFPEMEFLDMAGHSTG